MTKPKIEICVDGGAIASVAFSEEIPKDLEVVILDYDVEGLDPDRIEMDSEGLEMIKSTYGP